MMNANQLSTTVERPLNAASVSATGAATPPRPEKFQHQPLRVLQTGRAPAQMSLFLRPGMR